ncbi:MAG: serine/threonine-protein kinase PknK [Sandaracinaceae bacterium]|nr:serine/threonine-protein kinase PknK [Sandaracinaceae bacterium]
MVSPAPPRFRLVRELGQGGMGSVDLVWDDRRQEEVARKRCRVGGASPLDSSPSRAQRAFARLKREFRSTAELSHPALVRVYELGEDRDGVYFTMEAIDGVDLLRHCRPELGASGEPSASSLHPTTPARRGVTPTEALAETLETPNTPSRPGSLEPPRPAGGVFDEARLAAVLPSILAGLSHLHARGLVHRDLKPSNVLVDREGRVRIVDFGILAELAAPRGEMAGTPAYMAPEQIRGAPPTPAMDLYALGVTLFELVVGTPPFAADSTLAMFGQHLGETPRRLRDCAPGVLPELDEAVASLLAKDPAQRPTLTSLAASLLPAMNAEVPRLEAVSLGATDLVGRELLQLRIVDLLGRSPQFGGIVLEGPSGVGKTALGRWASEHARSTGWAVLHGRARPNELLPFNAVDGLVDDLEPALSAVPNDERLTLNRLRASAAFPILGHARDAELDSTSAREIAFDGVIGLLGALAAVGRGVLLVIDDLQWADADSLSLLESIALAAPSGVKLVATFRDDLPAAGHVAWVDRRSQLKRVTVPPLDVSALAMIASRAAGDALDADAALRIAESCAGRAYFAEVAGRLSSQSGEPSSQLGVALTERLGALGEAETRMLGALVAADGWLDAADLATALDVTVGVVDGMARTLSELAVVRRTGVVGPGEQLDLYHDVARVAALEALGDAGLRAGHQALAELLDRSPGRDPLRLVRHLAGAGRGLDAATRAEAEAQRALTRHAYGLAAELYALAAASLVDRQNELGRSRSAALIRAGLYEEAVAQLDALEARSDAERAELAFDRAYALLMAGSTPLAKRSLDDSLRMRGLTRLARPGLSALWEFFRVWRGPPRPPAPQVAAAEDSLARERAEREAEVVLILTWEDPVAAVSWAHRMRKIADRDRRPERGAFADYALAFFNVATQATAPAPPLVAQYLASARARLVDTDWAADPYLDALDHAVVAFLETRSGRFAESAAGYDATARALEAVGRARSYLHLLARANVCGALMCGELVEQLAPSLDVLDAACPPEQGTMENQSIVLRASYAAFRHDRLQYFECRERLRANEAASDEYYFHHMLAEVMGSCGELYFGDPREARARNAAAMERGKSFRVMSTYFAGGFSSFLALHEAAALRMGDPDASPKRIARWAKIARGAPPIFNSGAVRAEAYAADHLGRPERALELLAEAERMADAFDLRVSRGIARYQRGVRLGGDEGASLVAAGLSDLRSVGASELIAREDRGLEPT